MSTPAYFHARQAGFMEDYKNGWERTRFLSYIMAKTVDSKNKLKKPSDIVAFPWEPKKKFKKLTKQEREDLEKFDREADLILQKLQPERWAEILRMREEEAQKQHDGG